MRNKIIICIIMAMFTVLAFASSSEIITNNMALEELGVTSENVLIVYLCRFKLNYENTYGINSGIMLLFSAYFYYQLNKEEKNKRLNVISSICAIVFSFFMIFGRSFFYSNSWDLVLKNKFQIVTSIINYIGYFFLFKYIFIFIVNLKNCNNKNIKNNDEKTKNVMNKFKYLFIKINKIELKHPILFYIVLFFICWIPYIIIFFPGSMNPDAQYEIEQFLGIFQWTTHHPIFPTVIYGMFMKIAIIFSLNFNIGIFLNNILQIILAAILLSYSLNYIYKLTKNNKIKLRNLLVFCNFSNMAFEFLYRTERHLFYAFSSFVFYYVFEIYKSERSINKERMVDLHNINDACIFV